MGTVPGWVARWMGLAVVGAVACTTGAPLTPRAEGHVRWMVVAPHPDDEALIAGGLLARAAAAHEPVLVVVMTNGDYECNVDGAVRENESVAAMGILGVPENRVHYLAYPDGYLSNLGTKPLGTRRLIEGKCVEGNTTYGGRGATRARGTSYTRENAIADLAELLRDHTPEDIVVTHPDDTHPDHATTYTLVREAMGRAHAVSAGAAAPRLHRAVVHNGDCWPMGPLPSEPCPDTPIDSAARMPELSGRLSGYLANERLGVSDHDRHLKTRAIAAYDTQTRHGAPDSYLFSYSRGDEMFFLEREPAFDSRPAGLTADRRTAAKVISGSTLVLGRYRVELGAKSARLLAGEELLKTWPLPHDFWETFAPLVEVSIRPVEGATEILLHGPAGLLGVATDAKHVATPARLMAK